MERIANVGTAMMAIGLAVGAVFVASAADPKAKKPTPAQTIATLEAEVDTLMDLSLDLEKESKDKSARISSQENLIQMLEKTIQVQNSKLKECKP